jgi:transcriptional regulator with XRE-family HTH domain
MEKKDFGKELLELRSKKKISQQKLAGLSSYTQTYISLIETNRVKPSARCIKALKEVLEK